MSNTLSYGRRRSRRHWRVLIVALLLAVAASYFPVRAWQRHRVHVEAERLIAELRAEVRALGGKVDP